MHRFLQSVIPQQREMPCPAVLGANGSLPFMRWRKGQWEQAAPGRLGHLESFSAWTGKGGLFLSLFSYVPCSNIYDRASPRMGNSVPHLLNLSFHLWKMQSIKQRRGFIHVEGTLCLTGFFPGY